MRGITFNPLTIIIFFIAAISLAPHIIKLIVVINRKKREQQYKDDMMNMVTQIEENTRNKEYKITQNTYDPNLLHYHRKYILTPNEYYFYKELKKIADEMGYTILTKIRMADIIATDEKLDYSAKMSYFGRISQKHVDFALAKPNDLKIELLIELDDSSHNRKNRIERDQFIDDVYKKCGYKILHVNNNIELRDKIKYCFEMNNAVFNLK